MPFEMVDDVLERTRSAQVRIRMLPAWVAVYLLLAGVPAVRAIMGGLL